MKDQLNCATLSYLSYNYGNYLNHATIKELHVEIQNTYEKLRRE